MQHWIKETTYARHAKDADKKRAFALVNKATGQAIKHGLGFCHLVRTIYIYICTQLFTFDTYR
jgi:hypothetical protein